MQPARQVAQQLRGQQRLLHDGLPQRRLADLQHQRARLRLAGHAAGHVQAEQVFAEGRARAEHFDGALAGGLVASRRLQRELEQALRDDIEAGARLAAAEQVFALAQAAQRCRGAQLRHHARIDAAEQ
ncbi:hypothetical protein D9M72_552920 [compost metagenome]